MGIDYQNIDEFISSSLRTQISVWVKGVYVYSQGKRDCTLASEKRVTHSSKVTGTLNND